MLKKLTLQLEDCTVELNNNNIQFITSNDIHVALENFINAVPYGFTVIKNNDFLIINYPEFYVSIDPLPDGAGYIVSAWDYADTNAPITEAVVSWSLGVDEVDLQTEK